MADLFRKAGDVWSKADKALGGWLPGGGVGSPLTQYVKGRPTHVPGEKRTLEGDLAGLIDSSAAAIAGTRPAVKEALDNSPEFVRGAVSSGLNKLPASANLLGRYYTGLGNEGLEFAQQYKDNLFKMVEQTDKDQPKRIQDLKQEQKAMQEFAKDQTMPAYAKPTNDMLAHIDSDIKRMEKGDIQFRSRAGHKDDTDSLGGYGTSLGSAWFTRAPDGGYTTEEKYDFVYADADKKYPVPHGPYLGAVQPPSASKGFAYRAAETLLGRTPKVLRGTAGASPESMFGRAIVAKMDSDPFNYILRLDRPK